MKASEIDQHLENFQEREFDLREGFSAAQFKLFNICQTWAKIAPIVKFANKLLFWKPKWQKAINIGIAALDSTCEL